MSIGVWQIIILIIILLLYFLPYVIARYRNLKNKRSVFFLNLFLGWTLIGFFVLLFYSALNNTHAPKKIKK